MFIVVELQTNTDGTTGNIITTHQTIEEARSRYYAVLSAAAISEVPTHAAVLLRDDGFELDYMFFKHGANAEEQESDA